uniref:Nicotinamide phosphoribosyltransferase n=1 Tax=Angiostrongylus cantonensis TaxID=6313 RepID=A0A0K0DIG8_ANGCA
MWEPSFVENVLYLADSYKITHHNQYPEGTTNVYSYFESRGGKFPEVCFFGLQYILKRWLVGTVVTHEMIDDAIKFYNSHFNMHVFNEAGWRHIVEKHGGHLPLRIKAIPEGCVVPTKNVLFTIENTDPAVPWLTNWFESAGIGGAAHLVNFMSTDTIAGLKLCQKYYSCEMAGFSIPAAEHSTITTWKREGEVAAFRNMLKQYPKGLISVVSDSYDVFHAVSIIWGKELREEVIERGADGCLVIRPDSGDPISVLVKVLTLLEENFPVTVNSRGYKILPAYLRVIQGDGINYESTGAILEALMEAGWSTDNVVFGAGGALLQRVDRDTQKCAFKCSHVVVNGEQVNLNSDAFSVELIPPHKVGRFRSTPFRDVYKNPATDEGKRSKKGYLTLELNSSGSMETVQEGLGDPEKDLLQTVFEDGHLLVDWTLDEIRKRAEIDLEKMGRRKSHVNGYSDSSDYEFPELKKEDCEQVLERYLQKYISGWGPGGQKVNTAQNAVQLRHLPTGLVVKVHESRLLSKNIEIAFERMKHALDRHLNGDNCYEEQYKKLQRDKEARTNRKRESQRLKRKELIGSTEHSQSD